MILPDGVSVICGGLDHWFKHESGDAENIDQREYQVDEWRSPAVSTSSISTYRLTTAESAATIRQPTAILTVPFLRFPQWHYCSRCGLMRKIPLVTKGRIKVLNAKPRAGLDIIVQVPFVAMCDAGPYPRLPLDRMGIRNCQLRRRACLLCDFIRPVE